MYTYLCKQFTIGDSHSCSKIYITVLISCYFQTVGFILMNGCIDCLELVEHFKSEIENVHQICLHII